MKKKIVFLIMPESDVSWTNYSSTPPLSLISLGSYLKEIKKQKKIKNEISIFICDFNIEAGKSYFLKKFNELEQGNNLDLFFGISVNCFNIENSFKLAKEIKIKHPNSIIIFGGPYVTSYIFRYKRYDVIPAYVDYAISYYGEEALFDLIFGNSQNNSSEECPKCIKGREIPINNICLDYSLVEYLEKYQHGNENVNYFGGEPYYQLAYLSGFGCMYRSKQIKKNKQWCSFCSLIDKKFFHRNEASVLTEVKNAIDTLINKCNSNNSNNHIKNLLLRDVSDFPSVTLAKQLKELSKSYNNINIKILGYQRADQIKEENIEPFDIIFIGAESGNNSILLNCKKGFKKEHLNNAINILKCNNKKIIMSFILGLKGENYQTVEETKKFIGNTLNEGDFISAGINIYLPFPGSPFFDLLIEKLGIKHTVVFGIDDLKRLQKEWIKEFTNISLYDLVREKAEIENIIRNKLKINKYFDFGVNKRIEIGEGDVPSAFKDLLNSFYSHIIAIAEVNDIKGHWWGTASIKELLLKRIYNIKEDFINLNFFIGDNNCLFDNERKKFSALNGACFSNKNSILENEVIKRGLPTTSDILPGLNKSLMMIKNPPEDWQDLKYLFDYVEILHDDLQFEFTDIKEKILEISQNGNYLEVDNIIRDYKNICEDKSWEEDKIRKAFKLIFFMYEMHLTLLGYDIFIYYPIKTTSKGSVAFTLGLRFNNFKNKAHFKNFIINYIKLLNITIIQRLFDDVYKENIKNSTNSAIAAIMSRNMSHNIGSHVLARLVSHGINGWTKDKGVDEIINSICQDDENIKSADKKKSLVYWAKDVQNLLKYLQQRQDFLAMVSTEWPEWTDVAYFMQEIMRWFFYQKLILDYIAGSEGLSAHNYEKENNKDIRFHVFLVPEDLWRWEACSVDDRFIQIKNNCGLLKGKEEKLGCNSNDNECPSCRRVLLYTDKKMGSGRLSDDIQVAVPGGLIGYHAFYVLLENIIRNSAKHSFKNEDHLDVVIEILYDPKEKIGINLNKEKKPAYLFRIYNNVGKVTDGSKGILLWKKEKNGDIKKGINDYLGTPLIDETGKLKKECWGMAEMKVAAGFLQGRDIVQIGAGGEKIYGPYESGDLMQFAQRKEGSTYIIRAIKSPIGTLGYEFYVRKPKMIGIVCKKEGQKK